MAVRCAGPVSYDDVRYPSDMSDAQWQVMRPVLEAWKNARPSISGHQGRHQLRELVNAIFSADRLSVALPAEGPSAVGCGLLLLCAVAGRRHDTDHSRPAALAGAGAGRPCRGPDRGGDRLADATGPGPPQAATPGPLQTAVNTGARSNPLVCIASCDPPPTRIAFGWKRRPRWSLWASWSLRRSTPSTSRTA